jgi:NAD(P)-dependent dehydrogenase (short-subunit alcohol dehydrogenase family)
LTGLAGRCSQAFVDEDGERLKTGTTGHLRSLLLDVTDVASIEAAVKEIAGRLGDAGLTAVVNNAGIALGGPVEYLALDEWRRQFEVNVIGQVAVTKAVLPLIRRSASPGRVVFMGSIGGRVASPFIAPYAASKHAIEAIAESMRHELAVIGIRTVVVEPGAVRTPIWDKGRAADDIEASLSPEALERYGPAIVGLRKTMEFQARTGVDPALVARVVERAVTSSRPAARYLVGRDAQAMAMVAQLLPDRARDLAMRMSMRLVAR